MSTLADTIALITGHWMTEPTAGLTYRIGNYYYDSRRATKPYPTIAQQTWADADSDGMPDWLEKRLSGMESDSTSIVSSDDEDGDGYTNIEEWWINMIPLIQSAVVKR